MSEPDFICTIDTKDLEKRFSASQLEEAQEKFSESFAFRTRKRVPEDEGTLRDSEPLASNYKQGYLMWNTPYAQDVWNADSVRKVKNPLATPQWAEVTKAEELPAIKQDAVSILNSLDGGSSNNQVLGVFK